MGVRASGRILDQSHSTILRWQQRVAQREVDWSPDAPATGNVTLENDELYTRVGENLSPSESEGWTMTCIERNSCYWVSATVGRRDQRLFECGVTSELAMGKGLSICALVSAMERSVMPISCGNLPVSV